MFSESLSFLTAAFGLCLGGSAAADLFIAKVEFDQYSNFSGSHQIKGCGLDQFGYVYRYSSSVGSDGKPAPIALEQVSSLADAPLENVKDLMRGLSIKNEGFVANAIMYADLPSKAWQYYAGKWRTLRLQGWAVGMHADPNAASLVLELERHCGAVGEDLAWTEKQKIDPNFKIHLD